MIQFLKVSKQYGSSDFALRDVDLAVSRGEFVFVTGPTMARFWPSSAPTVPARARCSS
jgi:ABC-type ATPase involved in cell division